MNSLDSIRRLLEASSDRSNPDAATVDQLLRNAQRIAVVGLSRDPTKVARRIPSYLATKGYEVVPVNPHAERLLGQTSYDTVGDVPGEVDLVLVFRPSEAAGHVVKEALERPERPSIWLQSGIRADPEIEEARAAGVTAVQDLCIFQVRRVFAE